MGKRRKQDEGTLTKDERTNLVSARGWRVDPWAVQKGDTLIVRESDATEVTEAWLVSNVLTGTIEKRVIVEVPGGLEVRFVAYAARTDREIGPEDWAKDWNLVVGHLRSAEVRSAEVPAKKKRAAGVTEVTEVIEVIEVIEDDPTDRGVSPGRAEAEDPEEDGAEQLEIPETLPTLDEAKSNVERLRSEWETKREEQERQAIVTKKFTTRLAKAKKAESLAYESLVGARVTLDRVVGWMAVKNDAVKMGKQ